MTLSTFLDWQDKNPPAKMPFYPGAATTAFFGVRAIVPEGASPLHPGTDRSGGTVGLVMPFDGTIYWRVTGHAAGTVLTLVPDGMDDMELQVFHTFAPYDAEITLHLRKGDALPVQAGSSGVSTGKHTHAELLFRHSESILDWVSKETTWIVSSLDGHVNPAMVPQYLRDAALLQVKSWGIIEMSSAHAVRESLPEYRRPAWDGPTIIADTLRVLDI